MDYNLDEHILALISCIEVVLMRKGNVNYNLVLAKLHALYSCKIMDCYDHPEYLKTVLKEVYKEDYDSIIKEIRLELGDLDTEEIGDFINIMLKP
jgi:hypothetical protein